MFGGPGYANKGLGLGWIDQYFDPTAVLCIILVWRSGLGVCVGSIRFCILSEDGLVVVGVGIGFSEFLVRRCPVC